MAIRAGREYILGIRPEHIQIQDGAPLACQVYSSLPSGMETVLRLQKEQLFLNCVVFDTIDYPAGMNVGIFFTGNRICLFDAVTGQLLSLGQLSLP